MQEEPAENQRSDEPDAWEKKKARDAKEKKEESQMNQFDGTIHHDDGSREFP